ncbi:hypothetical protein MF271_06085 [Deinococcus sp. KNUC1210]|uniref:hypothetical protein n=1 Tax=Deinococcus sp. KNUC1210 TaxID=2917691 RepID=UPI001EF05914|nr:hypothetical protein [Deinococcus sp. KNUC1210]ULH16182.1 hypothetical protein MF271_06085 [Deinococcus sp. KNUC1210]
MSGAPMTASALMQDIHALILAGHAPAGLSVGGPLKFAGKAALTHLPADLSCSDLDVSGCVNLDALPEGLNVTLLNASGTGLRRLPALVDSFTLHVDLSGCTQLTELPAHLRVGTLNLSGCTALRELPEGLCVNTLNLSGCTGLRELPESLNVRFGHLNVRGTSLASLPHGLGPIAQLDLRDCPNLRELPADLRVTSWIELANSGLESLPPGMVTPLRWNDVRIDEMIAFHPERLSGLDALKTPNIELRRVKIERIGFERLLTEVRADELNRDTDAGGGGDCCGSKWRTTNRWWR